MVAVQMVVRDQAVSDEFPTPVANGARDKRRSRILRWLEEGLLVADLLHYDLLQMQTPRPINGR